MAPGHDGGQKLGFAPGREHQQVPLGRLLQGFQQGVGRGVTLDGQGFGGLDKHHPPAAPQGRIFRQAAQFPDHLDLDLGLPLFRGDHQKVGMGARLHAAAGGAGAAGVAIRPGLGAVQGRGQGPGRGGLAHAPRPQEQVGMGQPARQHGGLQMRHDPILPQNLPEKPEAGFLGGRWRRGCLFFLGVAILWKFFLSRSALIIRLRKGAS